MPGVILPQQLSAASAWQLVDVLYAVASTLPAVGGVASVELPQVGGTEKWLVDHAVVSCTSSTPTQLRWYEGAAAPVALLDGSGSGNFDVGDWPQGMLVSPAQSLVARWTGASDGAVGTVRVQYRLYAR